MCGEFLARVLQGRQVLVEVLRDRCGEATFGVRVRGLLDLFVAVEAACNSRLRRLEATSVLVSRSATELGASKVPVLFGGADLFLGLREAPPCFRGDPQGFAPHRVNERGEVRGFRVASVVLLLFAQLGPQLEKKGKDE